MAWLCECGSVMGCLSTRRQESGNTRRYRCPSCGKRQTTIEVSSRGLTNGKAYRVSDFRNWHAKLISELEQTLEHIKSVQP